MDLILWRHAEAEDGVPGRITDDKRALTEHGHKQARKMAEWLDERLPKNCRILVSPAVRTQQTMAALKRDFTISADIGTSTTPKRLLAAAGWQPDADATVMVVGHQPTLGEVVGLLLATGGADPDEPAEMDIKKGAVVWISGKAGGNVLKAAMTPKLV